MSARWFLAALALIGGLAASPARAADPPDPGIAWFSTWTSGVEEAQRSGRPILLVAAAPHCSGVPGIW